MRALRRPGSFALPVAAFATASLLFAQQRAAVPLPVTGIAICADGSSATCSPAGITFTAPSRTLQVAAPDGRACVVAALPAGGFVVGGGEPGRSGWLWCYDGDGRARATRRIGDDVVEGLTVAAAGECIAAGLATGQVLLWSVTGSEPVRELARHQGACRAVAFLDQDRVLLSAGRDGRLLRIALATGAIRENADHTAGVDCLAVGSDGSVASGALDGRVRLHDRDGRLLRSWQRLGGRVQALVPDGATWILGLDDGRLLRLRDLQEEAETLAELRQPIHVLAWAAQSLWVGHQGGSMQWRPPAQPRAQDRGREAGR